MTEAEFGSPTAPGNRDLSAGRLLLSEFDPHSELVVARHERVFPEFPVIDAHNHLSDEFGGGWHRRPVGELVDVLDRSGVHMLVDLDGGWGEPVLDHRLALLKDSHPDRFRCFGGVDWSRWPELGSSFPAWAAARLSAQLDRGADGLKVWKPFGLQVVDDSGVRVAVDDERLDCLWQVAADRGVPVMIHVGDPPAFFRPMDGRNERYLELIDHPDWHFAGSGYPPFAEIMGEFSRLVHRHRGTTFIGAHVGCYSENLGWVAGLLDTAPNFHVDIADRLDELSRQPYTARRFFEQYADRVIFGADRPASPAMYEMYYRFLQTTDEDFVGPGGAQPGRSWRLTGLGLEPDVLSKIYFENALRLLRT